MTLRRPSRRALKLLTLPAGRQLKTNEAFRYESARMLRMAFAYARYEKLEGDYLEFGVFEGKTFVEAWHAAEYQLLNSMRFVAFDSFEGLPALRPEDSDGPFQEGEYRAPREVFERTLRQHQVPASRVSIVEGLYDDTLADPRRIPVERCAIAYVDCDLYQSAVPVLDYLTHVVVDGSVIIFDDWFNYHGRPDRGEQRACAEWLAANPDIRLVHYRDYGWPGRSFIVNRD